jgi:hypothetical protein
MNSKILELCKCAVLTLIAVLLGSILWRLAQRPLTVYVKGGTIDYVSGGSIDADVHVENEPLGVTIEP